MTPRTPLTLLILAILFLAFPALAQYEASGCLNPAEEELAQLVNDYRVQNGLTPVPLSTNLTLVAQWHVADHNYADDITGEWGSDPSCNLHTWYGIPGESYTTCCYTSDHAQASCMWLKPGEISDGAYSSYGFENAAWGYTSVADALNGWQNSSGHNAVILNLGIWASYTWQAMGVGVDLESKRYFLWFSAGTDPAGSPEPCAISTVGDQLAAALEVRSIYPNPFNPTTRVSFWLPAEGHVRISVHDLSGRKIRTVLDEDAAAGLGSATWNGRDGHGRRVASGTYFFRVESGGMVSMKRATLLK
jgi:uncharacterized protein YkwD